MVAGCFNSDGMTLLASCSRLIVWDPKHLLTSFWVRSGLNPSKQFYPQPDGRHRCTVSGLAYKRKQDLKAQQTRKKHRDTDKSVTTKTAVPDVKQSREKKTTAETSVDGQMAKWRSAKLLSVPIPGITLRSILTDARRESRRIAMAKASKIWQTETLMEPQQPAPKPETETYGVTSNNLHLNLKLRLYRSSECMKHPNLTYGSEAWYLTATVTRRCNHPNDVNNNRKDIVTRSPKEITDIRPHQVDTIPKTTIFRMGREQTHGEARDFRDLQKSRSDDNMLMDAPRHVDRIVHLDVYLLMRFLACSFQGSKAAESEDRNRVTRPSSEEATTAPFTISY